MRFCLRIRLYYHFRVFIFFFSRLDDIWLEPFRSTAVSLITYLWISNKFAFVQLCYDFSGNLKNHLIPEWNCKKNRHYFFLYCHCNYIFPQCNFSLLFSICHCEFNGTAFVYVCLCIVAIQMKRLKLLLLSIFAQV